jgi:predicted esterase
LLSSIAVLPLQHIDFIPQQHIQPATPLTSMAPPFPVPPGALVIKVEDERESDVPGQVTTDQELRDMFTKDVQRRLELIRRRRGLQTSGSAQLQPPPAPPVRRCFLLFFILNC